MDAKIILMADNFPDFLSERKEFLERAGYTVITACNPQSAETILARGGFDLAVLDIRLVDDDDPEDTSGLELARRFGQAAPIILLTGFPTWENVKEALEQDLDGLCPAVDFLAKSEGPEVMVRAVGFTLEHPRLKANLLSEFQAESSLELHETLQKNELAETSSHLLNSLERTEGELIAHRRNFCAQAERYQKIAIWMGLVGMAVIVTGAVLALLNLTPLGVLTGVAGVIPEAVSVLFITRAVQASKGMEKKYDELQESYKIDRLISLIETIKVKSKREEVRIMILEMLAGKWIGSGAAAEKRDGREQKTSALRG